MLRKCRCPLLRKQWWKRLESAGWETRQAIKWEVKRLGLSMRLLGTLRNILSIIFWYSKICNIRQTFSSASAGYRTFYCTLDYRYEPLRNTPTENRTIALPMCLACRSSCSHSGVHEDSSLRGCYAAKTRNVNYVSEQCSSFKIAPLGLERENMIPMVLRKFGYY
jgi:hypothetical protein